MAVLSRQNSRHQCFGGGSGRRLPTVLIVLVVILVLMQLQFTWLNVRLYSTTDYDNDHFAEQIRDGYINHNRLSITQGVNPENRTNGRPQNVQNSQRFKGSIPPFQVRKLKGKLYDKWMVLDVTSGDCKSTLPFSPPGWTVIVAGEPTTSFDCKPPSCVRLDIPENITQPMTAETRELWSRNLVYLTAVSHKPLQILDVDCRTASTQAFRTLEMNSTKASGLMYNSTLHFNPYKHFGAWAAMPLALSNAKTVEWNSRLYYLRDFPNVLIKHGLNDLSDDVVRVTGSTQGDRSGTRFDASTPPVFVGHKTFSPAISRCTMYHPRAYWGLMLPCLADVTQCEILRQYITQRMLRELDAFSAYHLLPDMRSTSTSGPDLQAKRSDLVLNVDELAKFLDSWVCSPHVTFFACFKILASRLQTSGFLNSSDVRLIDAWLAAILRMGVTEPSRVASPWRGIRKVGEVPVVLGNLPSVLESSDTSQKVSLQKELVDRVKAQCEGKERGEIASVAQWSRPVITDIVLVIVFNYNRFLRENLPYLETIHRPFFKHIVYCTPNVIELVTDTGSGSLSHVTLMEGLSEDWYFMYECLTSAARLNIQGIHGYLQIGDDTLLNTWRMLNSSRDSIWLPSGFTNMYAEETKHRWGWYHWTTVRGRFAILHALSDLEKISGMTSEQLQQLDPNTKKSGSAKFRTFSQIFHSINASKTALKLRLRGSESWEDPPKDDVIQFLTNYIRVNRMAGKVAHRALDLIFIPQTLKDAFVKFSRYFMKYGVIIELAVPALHYGITPKSNVSYIKASSLWYGDRNRTQTFYNDAILFLHPFKMKSKMDSESGRIFFCDLFLPNLFTKLPKFSNTRT